MRIRYENRRTLVTLSGTVRLRLKIRRCEAEGCARLHTPYRPEAEGALALPQHEFGLDVVALVGALRHREHRSVPEIHAILRGRGVGIAERSVINLLDRYDELLAAQLGDPVHLRRQLTGQDRIVLALDGLQPDIGHEVLWVLRDCLSGTVLLARSLLSSTAEDLAILLARVVEAVGRPITGVISDGQHSIRKAVAAVLPGVPHQLCHFHFLREAALPIFEADRHAKKELKKGVRGVRPIERAVEGRTDPEAELVRGYAAAVRSAITDDGRAPLDAAGLRLKGRLEKVAGSLERVGLKGGIAPARAPDRASARRHGAALACGGAGLRLRARCRAPLGQSCRGDGSQGPAPLRWSLGIDAASPPPCRRSRGRPRPLPQGGAQLLARAVPRRRPDRPAAYQ